MIAQLTGRECRGHGAGHRRRRRAAAHGRPSRRGGERPAGRYRGAQGLDPAFIKELERQYGFDKPAYGSAS